VTRLFFGLALATLAITQATILPEINVLGIGPNLVLVMILLWSARHGITEGLLWAFPAGILLDLLSLDRFGTNGLALLPVALIGGLARGRSLHSGVILPMLGVVLATLSHQLAAMILGGVNGSTVPVLTGLRIGVLTALLNVALVPIFYLGMLILEGVGVVRAARS
jgi:rod shape-determining protein MreD